MRSSQYLSMCYTDRLVDAGIVPSVGSQGDAFDNALAEYWRRPTGVQGAVLYSGRGGLIQ